MKSVYFSFVSEYPKNVVISQVVEYLEMLDEFEVHFNLVFLIRLGAYISGFSQLENYRELIKTKIKGDISFFPITRKTNRTGVFFSVFILLFKLFKYRKYDKLIIHTRGGFGADVARVLKKFYSNIHFVYDIRGDVAGEFDYHAKKNNVPKEIRLKKLEEDKKWQTKITSSADKIFCVSNVLKNMVEKNYSADENKITVIPCLADHRKFFFDSQIRERIRKEYGIEDKFVFVYPGGIGHWHYSDKVFSVVRDLNEVHKNIFFFILTPHVKEAEEYAAKYLLPGTFLIKTATREEVPEILMASDMGLLLREHHKLNEVAAPTKFAEYLMTGLPVMISEDIGDYSGFINESKFGCVLGHNCPKEDYIQSFNQFVSEETDRDKISGIATESFAKIKYARIMKEIYTSI